MITGFISRHKYLIGYCILSVLLLYPWWDTDMPLKYDWAWPLFDMRDFLRDWAVIGAGNPISIFGKYFALILGLTEYTGLPPVVLLRIFMFMIHTMAGYGFFRFMEERVQSKFLAFAGGVAYAFTPYIFIRTIVGFLGSLVAYALLPVFFRLHLDNSRKMVARRLIPGMLLVLIFSQVQAGLLTLMFVFVHTLVSLILKKEIRARLGAFALMLTGLLAALVPWLVLAIKDNDKAISASGSSVTTLSFIASLPHSLRNFLMLSDHHITFDFFQPLVHEPVYVIGFLVVWFIAILAIFNRDNRVLAVSGLVALLVVLPFSQGPVGRFGQFYTWVYNHFSLINVFRETYHFEFLAAFVIAILFTLGSDVMYRYCNKLWSGSVASVGIYGIKALAVGGALVIIAPYLFFDYAGFLPLQPIPKEYVQAKAYFENNSGTCQRVFYPPGLGFIYFKTDTSAGAANSDVIASSFGLPYVEDGASVLNLPSQAMFYRNELISQLYEREDRGRFASLLGEGGVDCVIVRADLATKYEQVSNLGKEEDSAIGNKWANEDILSLVRSKQGLREVKNFGTKVYIFKPSGKMDGHSTSKWIQQRPARLTQDSVFLSITDWAREFAYYKDGWSRGRYDFWRKHLFTELRQDFIYTDRESSTMEGKTAHRGSYEVWARYLTGGTDGSFEISIDDFRVTVTKEDGEERFVWQELGEAKVINGRVTIKNVQGENAIADLVLVDAE